MKDFKTYFKTILKDLQVELSDEFDKNFERKAFFNEKWPQTKWANGKGSLMTRTGAGRRSIYSKIEGDGIVWRSSLPYMAIHNEGGSIEVTAQMKKFFWAMYYKSSNAISKKANGDFANTKRNQKLTGEAAIWKSLALMKVGKKMKIPERRFIGDHPQVKQSVKRVVDGVMKEIDADLKILLNPKNK